MSKRNLSPKEAQRRRERYYEHLRLENDGPGTYNKHPEGCYFCGSSGHFSDCCPEAERQWAAGYNPVLGIRTGR